MTTTTKSSSEENPYLALREAKIQRNEARLRELGLIKNGKTEFPSSNRDDQTRNRTSSSSSTSASTVRTTNSTIPPLLPTRRSLRLSSSRTEPVNYKEDTIHEHGDSTRGKRARVEKPLTETHVVASSPLETHSTTITPKPKPPPSANSVRGISICAQRLVLGSSIGDSKQGDGNDDSVRITGLLGVSLEGTGKEYVISKSFQIAGSSDDKMRLGNDPPRLSFNKYSGVQEWKDCIFLWVNLGPKGPSNSVVNEFRDDGTKITWYGGSRMVDDTPIVQRLIQWGKEATESSSKIVLWCRQYDSIHKRFHPYVCLGRLSYESHQPHSYPLAFVWSLLDAEQMRNSVIPEVRERFQAILDT